MSIRRATDLGERKVFEGPEADAAVVRAALEQEGIRVAVQPSHTVLARLHGAIYVTDPGQLEQARDIVRRYVENVPRSTSVIGHEWRCPSCGELVEGQFRACWNCGAPRP